MANRTVSVNLVANIGQYVSGMNTAAAATMRLGASATENTKKAQSGFDLAGKGAMLMGAAVVGGMAVAISKSMEFEKAMSAAAAATTATGAALGDLRDAAMEAGADTQYSATEAAQAITEMGKAGVSTADILDGGLNGALALAAAGQLDVAKAAEIASVAMTQFGLSGDKIPHVADLLAAGAGKAMGSVEDLGMALNQAGLVASSTGLSIEETTGSLAAFASAGLIGSDAGTSFRSMLQHLQNPSKESALKMAELGIAMYDAQGQFVGMESLAGQLQTKMEHLTPAVRDAAMAQIFGSDAVRAANVLYTQGASGIDNWTRKVNDQGYAAEQAAKLNDNLAGDLEKLGGAFDTLMIAMGSGAQGPLRSLVQGLTGALDGVVALGGPLKSLGGWAADNIEIVAALASVLAIQLTGGITAATVALNRFILTPVALGAAGLLQPFVAMSNFFSGGFLAAVGTARTALMGFLTTAAPLAAVASVAYGVTKVIEFATAAGDAREEIRTMWGAVEDARGIEQIDALAGVVGELETKVRNLNYELPKTEGAFEGFLAPLGMLENGGTLNALGEYEDALRRAKEQQEQVDSTAAMLGERFKLTRDEVLDLAGKYGIDLTGSLSESRRLFENFYTAEYGTTPIDAANATGAAMTSAKEQTEEAAKALENWLTELQDTAAGFVEPLGAYTGLLAEKQTADRETAEATAAATESSADSWKDYVTDVGVTFEEYKTRLLEQVTAQNDWQTNMLILAGRVSSGTLQELSRMGPEGAPLIADLVNRSDAELAELEPIMAQRSANATGAWAVQLAAAGPVLAAIGKTAGAGVVAELAAQLEAGTTTVAEIAAQYGISLAGGINPVLSALGKSTVKVFYNPKTGQSNMTGVQVNADGNLYEDHSAQIAPGGAWRVWAEPETGGEAYIPLAQGKRGRSLDIWRQTGKLLKAPEAEHYAAGGFSSVADVPKPPSTAPYQMPISTAADATMQKGFDEVRTWLAANLEPPAASGGSSTGLLPIMAAARQYVMDTYGVRNIGGFANRNIAGTNVKSDHAMGKAIDIMTSNLPLGWAIANDLAFGYAHKKFNIENTIWQQSISSRGGPFKRMADRGSITQNHGDHIHGDTFDTGGILPHGEFGVNLSGSPERVLNPRETVAYEAGMRSREFSGGSGGYGGGSAGPSNVVVNARVFVGNREITDIARVEAEAVVVGALVSATNRGAYNG